MTVIWYVSGGEKITVYDGEACGLKSKLITFVAMEMAFYF